MDTWSGAVKRVIKPVLMATLGRGEHFGEISVMQSRARGASAVATQKTTLLCIDKLEFLHMVNRVGALSAQMNQGKVNMLNRYPRDEHILRLVGSISGGPNSFAKSGEKSIFPNKSKAMRERERRAERILHPSKSSPGRSGPGSIVQERSITSSHEETQEERNRRKRHEASRSYLREQEDIQLQKALRKEAMGAQLREHASQVGASAEIQAKREIEMGKRILIEATTHKNVDMDPLRIFRGNAATSMGNTMGFRKDTARAADFKPTMRELETGWR
jgi:CRP-like cAMP-binding protein